MIFSLPGHAAAQEWSSEENPMVLGSQVWAAEISPKKAANFDEIYKNKFYDQLEALFLQKITVSAVACQINVSVIYTRMVDYSWLQAN